MTENTRIFADRDLLPVGVFRLDPQGRIRYYNRYCRALFGNLRLGMRFDRLCDRALPFAGNGGILTLCGKKCAVFCPAQTEPADENSLYACVILPERFPQSASGQLYDVKRSDLFKKSRAVPKPDPNALRRHLLRLIRDRERLTAEAEVLFSSLSRVRNVRPQEAFAFSASDFLSFFSAAIERFRNLSGRSIEVYCQTGVTLFGNYRDLHTALLCVLCFLTTVLRSDKLCIRLSAEGQTATIAVYANDPCGEAALYAPAAAHRAPTEIDRAMLFPLYCAESLCRPYRGTLRFSPGKASKKPVKLLSMSIPTTLELPNLTVRAGEHRAPDKHFHPFFKRRRVCPRTRNPGLF